MLLTTTHKQAKQTFTTMHSISVLKSALQKFIRRGMHEKVLAVTKQLCDRMFATKDVVLWETFWSRLHVIASEDIGIAQYGTHIYLQNAKKEASKSFFAMMGKDGGSDATRPTMSSSHEAPARSWCLRAAF